MHEGATVGAITLDGVGVVSVGATSMIGVSTSIARTITTSGRLYTGDGDK